jgi:uncharacterized membrane protein
VNKHWSAELLRRHPAVEAHLAHRAGNWQLLLADRITRFAGSMWFVWGHVIWFMVWMLFAEPAPWPKLTLVVSLEAIFLSTFVVVGQNRQGEFQRLEADHDFTAQTLELRANTELTQAIHDMTRELHTRLVSQSAEEARSAPGSARLPAIVSPGLSK